MGILALCTLAFWYPGERDFQHANFAGISLGKTSGGVGSVVDGIAEELID
jgi:hypothetical protein